jgi:hypothetical protein
MGRYFLQLASQELEEQEAGVSGPLDADCMRHQPVEKLQFGQDVPLFFGQLYFGFAAPQTADNRSSHLPKEVKNKIFKKKHVEKHQLIKHKQIKSTLCL